MIADEVRSATAVLLRAGQGGVIDYRAAGLAAERLYDASARLTQAARGADLPTQTGILIAVQANILDALIETNRLSMAALGFVEMTLEGVGEAVADWEGAARPRPEQLGAGPRPANVLPFVPRAAIGLRLPDDRADPDPLDRPPKTPGGPMTTRPPFGPGDGPDDGPEPAA